MEGEGPRASLREVFWKERGFPPAKQAGMWGFRGCTWSSSILAGNNGALLPSLPSPVPQLCVHSRSRLGSRIQHEHTATEKCRNSARGASKGSEGIVNPHQRWRPKQELGGGSEHHDSQIKENETPRCAVFLCHPD